MNQLKFTRNFLDIINVKDSSVGCRKRSIEISYFFSWKHTTANSERVRYLQSIQGSHGLSIETSLSCALMCDAFPVLTEYLPKIGFQFVFQYVDHVHSDVYFSHSSCFSLLVPGPAESSTLKYFCFVVRKLFSQPLPLPRFYPVTNVNSFFPKNELTRFWIFCIVLLWWDIFR